MLNRVDFDRFLFFFFSSKNTHERYTQQDIIRNNNRRKHVDDGRTPLIKPFSGRTPAACVRSEREDIRLWRASGRRGTCRRRTDGT